MLCRAPVGVRVTRLRQIAGFRQAAGRAMSISWLFDFLDNLLDADSAYCVCYRSIARCGDRVTMKICVWTI